MVVGKRKRILMVAGRLPIPPFDGGTMRIFNLARRWKEDFELTLVAPTYETVPDKLLAWMGDEMGATIHPVPVVLRPKSLRILTSLKDLTHSVPQVDPIPEVAAYLQHLLVTHAFDVVQLEGSASGNYLSLVQEAKTRSRVILVFYDVMWDWWRREFFVTPRPVALYRWLLYRYWEPKFASSADACIFLSEIDRGRVESVTSLRQSRVVPNGIIGNAEIGLDPPAGVLPSTMDVLFVGSFNHLPNLKAALYLVEHIWPEIQTRVPQGHLTIVGRNPPEALYTLAQSAGVEVIGNAPDLTPYYRRCRVVIVPIQSGGGIRVKILEAFAQGRPVVTTRIGAEGLPVVDNKHVLFADTPDALADAVYRLIEDEALAQSLVVQGRQLVESEFNWDTLAKRQAEVFE